MRRLWWLTVLVAVIGVLIGGCGNLRFAPTEAQKQIALQAAKDAMTVQSNGAQARSPITGQLVEGTTAALAYIGPPKQPTVVDYPNTVAQAQNDAAQRPTPADVMDKVDAGMGLISSILLAVGAGGLGIGGKKAVDLIAQARQRAAALREVVAANELTAEYFKSTGNTQALQALKTYQNQKQSGATEVLVASERAAVKRPAAVAPAAMDPAVPGT